MRGSNKWYVIGLFTILPISIGALVAFCLWTYVFEPAWYGLDLSQGMNPLACYYAPNWEEEVTYNGIILKFDKDTAAQLDAPMNSYIYPNDQWTYRTYLMNATAMMRETLARNSDDDAVYQTSMKYIPTVFATGGSEHFAYSGECAHAGCQGRSRCGCVYSHRALDLIPELSDSWWLHEYAHVHHTSLGTGTPQYIANTDAYNALSDADWQAISNKWPNENAYTDDQINGGFWYAAKNEFEYFACESEGYFSLFPNEADSNSWPRNRTTLLYDDPVGYAACEGLWSMSKSEIEEAQQNCVPLEAWVDFELIIYLAFIFGPLLIFILPTVTILYYKRLLCFSASGREGEDMNQPTHTHKIVADDDADDFREESL